MRSNELSWGRWKKIRNSLVYQPPPETRDPDYDLRLDELGELSIDSVITRMKEKTWIQESDLDDIRRAHQHFRAIRLENELCDNLQSEAPPMRWDSYRDFLTQDWGSFLDNTDPSREKLFQDYLEKHPCLLPHPWHTAQGYKNGSHVGAIFSQPELPGFRSKRPDFMLFYRDSIYIHALLVEIEAPAKSWSTRQGKPSAKLNQAIHQLREWKTWFNTPENHIAFRKLYEIDRHNIQQRPLKLHYALIYGRRDEAISIPTFAQERANLAMHDEVFMTYDRLSANPNLAESFTVTPDRSTPTTNWRAMHISPCFRLTEEGTLFFAECTNRENAITKNTLLTNTRKEFLLSRIPVAEKILARTFKNTP